jgi:hypothetical protein
MCWLCGASFHDENHCYDFGANAPWRRTLISSGTFLQEAALHQHYVSAVWKIPGFRLSYVKPDFMHVCCIGILQYYSGNVMWELFKSFGGTYKKSIAACQKLQRLISVVSKRLKIEPPLRHLTVGMIRKSAKAKPTFKLKAAPGRYFLPILVEILETAFPTDTAHAQNRLNCAKALLSCYKEMEAWTDASPENLLRFGRRHLLLFRILSQNSTEQRCWNLFPKLHLFAHCVESCLTNPRKEWNYGDESEIGDAVRQSMHLHKHTLPVQLMQRYRCTFQV